MRAPPLFPPYRVARPPVSKRWLVAAFAAALAAGICTALVHQSGASGGTLVAVMLAGCAVIGTLWLFRLGYYRGAVLNARTWHQGVEKAQQAWWAGHRQPFGLQTIILIGPAGSRESEWLRVLRRESLPPEPRKEGAIDALRVARTFSPALAEREKQLAKMLALQWVQEGEIPDTCLPARCYWAGSRAAWGDFLAQMKTSLPQVTLPAEPKAWKGEETLAELAGFFSEAEPGSLILVAGCLSVPAVAGMPRPVGESAALWLVSAEAPVLLTRGETFEAASSESLLQVCQRAQEQSESDKIPDQCILFTQPERPELDSCGWSLNQYLQDTYWGDLGEMEALVVISLAALFARTRQEPCGWIATDPQHSLALGIVKPHG